MIIWELILSSLCTSIIIGLFDCEINKVRSKKQLR